VNLFGLKRILSFSLKHASVAERSAVGVFLITLLIVVIEPAWTLIPLVSFMVLCFLAPFLPRFGFYLPIVSGGISGQNAVALTFDDGPDPLTTPILLQLLQAYDVTATFFVIGRRVQAYPELIQAILRAGHSLGNHSFSHDSLVMFKGYRQVEKEVTTTQRLIQQFGVTPLIFRPPAGITYPGLRKVLQKCNLWAVNFSCRAFDRGNRSIKHLSKRILKRVRAGDIILLHDSAPPQCEHCKDWIVQIEAIILGLKARGLKIKPLDELILKPVMNRFSQSQSAQFRSEFDRDMVY
jgi:peptidoglycan/xylan/chitin deacetylase (PgdA/CDA1 family)